MAKYNPFTGQWETVPADWELYCNPFTQEWAYAPKNARAMFNPFTKKWETGADGWEPTYNAYEYT